MPYSLKGRNVLVTAGSRYETYPTRLNLRSQCLTYYDRGLGALICEKFAAEGSNIAINYAMSKDRAEQLSRKIEDEHHVKTVLIQGVRRSHFDM